jgi:CRISPR-associated protein (Cas_Cas02710)
MESFLPPFSLYRLRLEPFHLKSLSTEDADNPEAVHRLVDAIYIEAVNVYGLKEEEVVADYTGGTKSMTSGMVLACASPRRLLHFMKLRKYEEDGRAVAQGGSDPVAIDIRFELIPLTKRRSVLGRQP